MGNLRRLPAVAAGFVLLALCFAASAVASTPAGVIAPTTTPAGVIAPTTRPLATPGIQAANTPFSRAQLAKKVGVPSFGVPNARSSLAPNRVVPSSRSSESLSFLGCFGWNASYYRCIYNEAFNSGGYLWYREYSFFYQYGIVGWQFYGFNQWFLSGGYWGWNGWYCCYA